jgi:hypothetical protein
VVRSAVGEGFSLKTDEALELGIAGGRFDSQRAS